MSDGVLSGVRVLDLTRYVAGPYCTKLLADLGADVLKVETPGRGDPARNFGPFPSDQPDPEKSGLFLHLNTNKRGITLNLKTETGRQILRHLLQTADVLVENFRPGVMHDLRLDYDSLALINPGLVMTSISNFGQTGPYRDYKAQDIVLQALGGLMVITGEPGRPPVKAWGYQAQYIAGLTAALGATCALHAREETGEGQHVDVSIMEAVLSIVPFLTTAYLYFGSAATRKGSRGPVYPTNLLRCKDGYVNVMVGTETQYQNMWAMVGRTEVLDDPDLQSWVGRFAHADKIDSALTPWLIERGKEEVYEISQLWRLPFSPVYTIGELLKSRQLKAREYFVEAERSRVGSLLYPGAPFKMSETPWSLARPAPLLGQHNEEVYCGMLGYTKQELVALHQREAV